MRKNSFKIFKSQNLLAGFTEKRDGDFSSKVLKNLEIEDLVQKINQPVNNFKNFYFMEQIHGAQIRVLSSKVIRKLGHKNFIEEVDGLITNQKDLLLLVRTADCLPVSIFDPQKKIIAAVHSGWRGTVGKIVPKAILKMMSRFSCQPKDLLIGIGPSAHKCCFKHDKKAFVRNLPEWQDFSEQKSNFWFIDLVGKLKHDLIDIGVKEANIEVIPICTICNKQLFSHTRFKKGEEKKGFFISYIGMPK